MQAKNIQIILKVFLNTWIIWMVFMKILKNKIEIRNAKYWLHLTIWLLTFLVIKKLNPTVTELFIRGRKSNISLVYIAQSSFALEKKNIMLNSAHYFMMSVPRKLKLQQSAFNHSSCIGFRNFTTLWKHVPQNRIHF